MTLPLEYRDRKDDVGQESVHFWNPIGNTEEEEDRVPDEVVTSGHL